MTSIRNLLAAALSAAGIAIATAASAQDSQTVTATYGDWEIRCGSGDNKLCGMTQSFKDGEGRTLAFVKILRLKDQNLKDGTPIPAQLEIVVPLGVILTDGLAFQVDASKGRRAPYRFCTQGGCRVLEPITDGFVTELKGGSSAKITYNAVDGAKHEAPISLKGFTKAYDSLTPAS